jgi:hypothetical protein
MDVLMLVLAAVQAWSTTAPAIRTLGGGGDEGPRLRRHRAAVVHATQAIARSLLGQHAGDPVDDVASAPN